MWALGALARAISVDGLGGTGRKAGGDSQQREPFWKPEREKVRNGAGRGEVEGRQGQCSEALCRPVTAPEVVRGRRPVWAPGSAPARRALRLPTQETAAASAENSRCPVPWRSDSSALLSYLQPAISLLHIPTSTQLPARRQWLLLGGGGYWGCSLVSPCAHAHPYLLNTGPHLGADKS